MHEYVIGATRSGKTNYLKTLVRESERPFCFIDKHGEAAKEIADASECIYWRPSDTSHFVALNPLQGVHPDLRWKATADIVSIFSDIWGLGTETPRLLYYLRASIRLLLDNAGTSLLDIRRVLSDESYRSRLVRRCGDQETNQTWREFTAKPARQQTEEVASLQNKVAALASYDPLRLILGSPRSTLNVAKVLERGQTLVLDLSGLGDEPAAILGAIVIHQIKQAAETVRKPFDLYIDEFQNFGTSIISTILSESGKFGLNLILAHQFLSQLRPEIRDAVLGNCSTIVSFRVGAEDAPMIAKALHIEPGGLQDLPLGHAFARTLLAGTPTSTYLLRTERADLPTGRLEANIRNTRANYARQSNPTSRSRNPTRRANSW